MSDIKTDYAHAIFVGGEAFEYYLKIFEQIIQHHERFKISQAVIVWEKPNENTKIVRYPTVIPREDESAMAMAVAWYKNHIDFVDVDYILADRGEPTIEVSVTFTIKEGKNR